MTILSVPPEPLTLRAADGYRLKGFLWRHAGTASATRSVVIINAATSVRCHYYCRFAGFLFEHGFDVIAYDYRGVGESRPATLRGFDACWIDWGCLDFDAVLRYAQESFSGRPIDVVAHSVGGFVLGLAKSNHVIRRVFTMGAQYAYCSEPAIGHFRFFNSRFEQKLWHVPLEWLKSGRLPAGFPGVLIWHGPRSDGDVTGPSPSVLKMPTIDDKNRRPSVRHQRELPSP
ncbi:MAG: alpha/beta fold hydrolase [Verrucomicrobia bacterium]|nr:alpha/beta fold hydrolase [Verrucomicrobiota bacterium]